MLVVASTPISESSSAFKELIYDTLSVPTQFEETVLSSL